MIARLVDGSDGKRPRSGPLALVVAVAMVLAACGGSTEPDALSAETSLVAAPPTSTPPADTTGTSPRPGSSDPADTTPRDAPDTGLESIPDEPAETFPNAPPPTPPDDTFPNAPPPTPPDDTFPNAPPPTPPDDASSTPVAPGTLFFIDSSSGSSQVVALDLDTGATSPVTPIYPRGFSASDDGQELVLTDGDDIILVSRSGQELGRIGIEDSAIGQPRLSPDDSRVMVRESPAFGGDYALRIYDWSGAQLASYPEVFGSLDSTNIDSWDWISNDSLLFAQDHQLYRVDGLGNAPQAIASFADLDAYVYHLDVSPDGSQVAMTLTQTRANVGGRSNHVWVMNIDGSGLTQVTTSTTREDSPTWSPDGTRLAFRFGGSAPPGSPIPDNCPAVLVVSPADGLVDLDAEPGRTQIVLGPDGRPICAREAAATYNSDIGWR